MGIHSNRKIEMNMKILLSYGHDSNAPLIEKTKEYLSNDVEGNLKHEVWIDTSEIKRRSHARRICFVLSGDMRGICHFEN